MIERIQISLSLSMQEQWETEAKLKPGFDRFVMKDAGVIDALDIYGNVMDTFAPDVKEVGTPVTVDDLTPDTKTTSTPDGEPVMIEQNPTNTDIFTGSPGGHGELNPLVPPTNPIIK